MKTIWLTFLICAGSAAGLAADEFRTDINPALLYYQAFLVAPSPLSTAESDYVFSREGRGQALPERFGPIVAGYDNQFKLVRQAAASTVPCDWGLDLTRGPETLLPGLARCKAVAQAAKLRVMWELQQGRETAARDDLLAAFALARNTARDGTLIAVLVQIASEAINITTIAENFGRFSPETLQQVADGLDTAPARTTIAASMLTEKATFHDWLVRRVLAFQKEYPGNDAKAMEAIHTVLTPMESNEAGQTEIWEPVVRAAGGTSEGILKLLREEELLYQRFAAIMALPKSEYEDQAKAFRTELRASANPLVSIGFPSFEKARQREYKLEAWLTMVRAATEYKLHGEAGLQAVNDPFGQGPFELQRFVFEGVDRGFQLKSGFAGSGFPETLIFVEKEGPAFRIDGPHVGESLPRVGVEK